MRHRSRPPTQTCGVHFQAINGSAIEGRNWWYTYVEHVNVESSGSAAEGKPAINMQRSDSTNHNSGCNNSFVDFKVEGSDYMGLVLGSGSQRNRFWGGKFHGVLPTPTPYGHVVDGAYTNYFTDMNFTLGGAKGPTLKNTAKGNSVKGGQIDAQPEWGIDTDTTTSENLVSDVIFSFAGSNRSGDERDLSGKNVFSFGSVFTGRTTVGRVSGYLGDYRGRDLPAGRQVTASGSTYRRLDPVSGGAQPTPLY